MFDRKDSLRRSVDLVPFVDIQSEIHDKTWWEVYTEIDKKIGTVFSYVTLDFHKARKTLKDK